MFSAQIKGTSTRKKHTVSKFKSSLQESTNLTSDHGAAVREFRTNASIRGLIAFLVTPFTTMESVRSKGRPFVVKIRVMCTSCENWGSRDPVY